MHLENPGLTTIGKKTGKKKWASAEAKRNAEALQKNWATLVQTTRKPVTSKPVIAAKKQSKSVSLSPQMSTARITDTKKIPSLVTPGGECTKKEPVVYTGDKVLGIAVLHKSCLQPIFSQHSAIDVSKMRR